MAIFAIRLSNLEENARINLFDPSHTHTVQDQYGHDLFFKSYPDALTFLKEQGWERKAAIVKIDMFIPNYLKADATDTKGNRHQVVAADVKGRVPKNIYSLNAEFWQSLRICVDIQRGLIVPMPELIKTDDGNRFATIDCITDEELALPHPEAQFIFGQLHFRIQFSRALALLNPMMIQMANSRGDLFFNMPDHKLVCLSHKPEQAGHAESGDYQGSTMQAAFENAAA